MTERLKYQLRRANYRGRRIRLVLPEDPFDEEDVFDRIKRDWNNAKRTFATLYNRILEFE